MRATRPTAIHHPKSEVDLRVRVAIRWPRGRYARTMHTAVLVQLMALLHGIRCDECGVCTCAGYGNIPSCLRHLAGSPGAPILLRLHELEAAVGQYFIRGKGLAIRIDEMYRQSVLQDTCIRILVRESSILLMFGVELIQYLNVDQLFCDLYTRAQLRQYFIKCPPARRPDMTVNATILGTHNN